MVLYVSVQQGDGGLVYCYTTLLHMICGVLLLDLLRFSECYLKRCHRVDLLFGWKNWVGKHS